MQKGDLSKAWGQDLCSEKTTASPMGLKCHDPSEMRLP